MSTAPNDARVGMTNGKDGSTENNVPSQFKVLTISFNQDSTALAMGTMKAYSLFSIDQTNKIDQTRDCGIEPVVTAKYLPFDEVRIIERLFSSSLVALVSDHSPRKLTIFHYKKGSEINSRKFPTTILAVKLNRLRFIVCLDDNIWIHDIKNLNVLHTIVDMPSNPEGLCALSSNTDNPFLAYPGSAITGEIHIFDTINLKYSLPINAHDGPLVAMSFDLSGTRIATASNRGTVIRVHSVLDGSCLYELRRGVGRVATIYSLAFSPDSMFLASSSNTGTVHIFRLVKEKPTEEPNTWMGSFKRLVVDAAYYLPKQSSEVFTQERSFATVRLQSADTRTTIALNNLNEKLILFVACYDGVVSAYEVNKTEGGECARITQQLLFNVSLSINNELPTASYVGRKTANQPVELYPPNLFNNDNEIIPNSST